MSVPFRVYLVPCFSHFCAFFVLVILLLKISPSTGPKCCRVFRGMYLTGQICVLDKLCSAASYGAVGQEFKVSESTMYVKRGAVKQKYTQKQLLY